jgi:hypothetical protein
VFNHRKLNISFFAIVQFPQKYETFFCLETTSKKLIIQKVPLGGRRRREETIQFKRHKDNLLLILAPQLVFKPAIAISLSV